MTEQNPFIPYAAKGAALLDELIPDWPDMINVRSFSMSDCSRCAWGQTIRKRDGSSPTFSSLYEWARLQEIDLGEYGFDLPKKHEDRWWVISVSQRRRLWRSFRLAWLVEINARLQQRVDQLRLEVMA